MAAKEPEPADKDATAEHTGEGDRDAGKPAPGSGLDHRQARNTQSTHEHRERPTGGAHSQETDRTDP